MNINEIIIKGAREHNLKNVNLVIPRNKLIVMTGLSGSGKSSLAFDTIYAEGQRRYVESLSSYARQFLGQMEKPDVDYIEGLSPAISIDQKTTSRNPRSTVGTVTEIHDYLRLMYARIGVPHCPKCGKPIRQQTVDQIVDQILALPERTKLMILAPVIRGRKGEYVKLLEDMQKQGYVRARIDGELYELAEPPKLAKTKKHTVEIVIDRLVVRPDIQQRLTDSLETAMKLDQLEKEKAKRDAERILQEARAAADEAWREIDRERAMANEELDHQQINEARAEMRRKLNEAEDRFRQPDEAFRMPREKPSRPVRAGDTVELLSSGIRAEVLKVNDNGSLYLQAGIMKVTAAPEEVRLLENAGKKRQSVAAAAGNALRTASCAPELDIRGMMPDEADLVVERYLDNAYRAKLKTVTIIHGKGTGALRSAVQQMLRRNRLVKNYRLGRYGEGETGVTVVELK